MKEKYQIRSQGSNLTKYLAEQESMNTGRPFFGCVFHFFDTSYHPTTKDEIIINSQKKRFISSYLKSKGQTEVCSMGKWLGYMVELYHDGQWYNIDQWHRHANGQLRHHFLYTAPERDILSSAHDELALSRERICFSDLAAET